MKSRLRELRKAKGLTQNRLAEELGISQQNISRYEMDICTVPIDILMQLASYYNVSPEYILGLSDVKRDLGEKVHLTRTMEENFDFVSMYLKLNEEHQQAVGQLLETFSKIEKTEK